MKTKKTLDEIGNKHPFTVPENYFEDFALRMETQTRPQSPAIFQSIRPWLYMAAIFIGLFVLVQPILYSVKEKQEKQMISEELDVFVQNGDETDPLLEYLLDL